MDDVELLPQTQQQAQMAALAFAGIVGGGLIAYEAARSLKEGDLFKTDPIPEGEKLGVVATVGGVGMTAMMIREAAKEVGWKPLILGSGAIFAFALVVRAIRR